jgi:phosphoglycerate dehydrogenase-like enzyme
MPPQSELTRQWAASLAAELPDYAVLTPADAAEARRVLPAADAVYGWVPPDLLPLAQRLRWLQSPAIGPQPGFYYPELIAHPVVVCNPRGIYDDHIGQHIMMFVLALARGLPAYHDAQRARRWDQDAPGRIAVDLSVSTALIAGVGGIGHTAATFCHAFGMRVIGVDPRWEHPLPFVERHLPDELDALLPLADFVIVALPHTPATEGMWNAVRFRRMRSTAFFINVGRGLTTRLDDLADAIQQGVIAGCGLDVFEVEPLPSDHPLWSLPNVLLTPHVAGHRAANLEERQFAILLDNARRFATGQPLRNVVDKAVWY